MEESGDVQATVTQTVDGKTYVREDYSNTPGDTQFGDARCPTGKEVVGGGIETESDAQDVNATFPRDTGDANSAPEDEWRAWVQNNDQQAELGVSIYAICH